MRLLCSIRTGYAYPIWAQDGDTQRYNILNSFNVVANRLCWILRQLMCFIGHFCWTGSEHNQLSCLCGYIAVQPAGISGLLCWAWYASDCRASVQHNVAAQMQFLGNITFWHHVVNVAHWQQSMHHAYCASCTACCSQLASSTYLGPLWLAAD